MKKYIIVLTCKATVTTTVCLRANTLEEAEADAKKQADDPSFMWRYTNLEDDVEVEHSREAT